MNIKEMIDGFLACPKCKGKLELVKIEEKSEENGGTPGTSEREVILCGACAVYYPIEDDVPILLLDEARPYKKL